MSLTKMDRSPSHIEPRRTVIINQVLTTTAPSFTVSMLPYLHFVPRFMIIRQILYSNIAGTDSGTYLLSSNITGDNIAAFYVGIQGVVCIPESIIPLPSSYQQLTFTVTPANVAFGGPTGCLTLTLEFF